LFIAPLWENIAEVDVMRLRFAGPLLLAVLATACTSDDSAVPTAPSDGSTGGSNNVVTISSAGVSPQTIQIRAGERVLFVNNDSVVHEMSSDQHPAHTECPVINQVGNISPGQSKETGNFVTPQTCTYHDHLDALNPGLLGTIVIVE
jgi:plastocyanin|tara:strand:+ start:865 stop:1305 length:441 start_codon:yes stop_codon:yes gene_type:complete